MGKVRLGPVALTLIIVVLPFAGMWPDRSDAAGAKVLASASNAPQIVGASAKASGLIAVKQRSNRLNSKQAPPAQTNTDTSSSQGESSQGTSQSLTIEKKSVASIPSDSGPKSYPTYKKNSPDITLSLPQAIQIALTRNLTMADSRLAVQEKEYQRREAYSDFFPSITLQYSGTVDRYSNPLFTLGLGWCWKIQDMPVLNSISIRMVADNRRRCPAKCVHHILTESTRTVSSVGL